MSASKAKFIATISTKCSYPRGFGHSGAQVVDADEPNSILPGVFFGKGFGDLPDGLAWLRPFAITGAFVDELPFGATTTTLGFGAASGKAQSI